MIKSHEGLFRLRANEAPKAPLVEVKTFRLDQDGVVVINAQVKQPVTVPAVTLLHVHNLILVTVRQILRYLGVPRVGKDELDIVIRLNPQAHPVGGSKVQRYTALYEGVHRRLNPGERPVRHLVFVSIDVQPESLIAHTKRLTRRAHHRRSIRKLHSKTRKRSGKVKTDAVGK